MKTQHNEDTERQEGEWYFLSKSLPPNITFPTHHLRDFFKHVLFTHLISSQHSEGFHDLFSCVCINRLFGHKVQESLESDVP